MEPHSIVVMSLHTPKERLWGELDGYLQLRRHFARDRSELVRRFRQPGAASRRRPHRPAYAFLSHAAHRTHRAGRTARLDSIAGGNVRKKDRPLARGLSGAVCIGCLFPARNYKTNMNSRILTVPNQLTFLRLAFLPFFIMAIHYERYSWALVILIVGGIHRRAGRISGARAESENSARRVSRSHRG